MPGRAVIGLVVVQGKGREEGQQDTCDQKVSDDLNSAWQGEENEKQQKAISMSIGQPLFSRRTKRMMLAPIETTRPTTRMKTTGR